MSLALFRGIIGAADLRYMKGDAPFARTPLYTASSALLILDDSTKRSSHHVSACDATWSIVFHSRFMNSRRVIFFA